MPYFKSADGNGNFSTVHVDENADRDIESPYPTASPLKTAAKLAGGFRAANAVRSAISKGNTAQLAQAAIGALGGNPLANQVIQKTMSALVQKNKSAPKCAGGFCPSSNTVYWQKPASPAVAARSCQAASPAVAAPSFQKATTPAVAVARSYQNAPSPATKAYARGVQYVGGATSRANLAQYAPQKQLSGYKSAQYSGFNKSGPRASYKAAQYKGSGCGLVTGHGPYPEPYAAPSAAGSGGCSLSQPAYAAQPGGGCGLSKPAYAAQPGGGCGLSKPAYGARAGGELNTQPCAQAAWNARQNSDRVFQSAAYGVTGISAVNNYHPSCVNTEGLMCTNDNAWLPTPVGYAEPGPVNASCGGQSYAGTLTETQLEYNPQSYAAIY
jgi:hypothetical protein